MYVAAELLYIYHIQSNLY